MLIVDDHEPHRTLLMNYLAAIGCACEGAGGGKDALIKLSDAAYDLVLLDLRMDDLDGMEVLRRSRAQGIALNAVMMSAEGTISHAVEAIRLGARDFLVKPFELDRLHATLERVLGGAGRGGPSPSLQWRDRFAPGLVGEHPCLVEVLLVLERIAETDCTVLILGESGTGKELVARAIHAASLRADKPFVPVNCGAIPETLIESELFGHAKGAFSGATQSRDGRFAVADTGTLFLDEIGEMSLSVQVKFLRVLQEQEYVPVGETKPRKCDVRIVAATNKNLEEMAQEGTFREDLFYRLNLIPLQLPPLRDRPDDVVRIAQHFFDRMHARRGGSVRGFSPEVMQVMQRYAWPGNVRELENTVERMMLLHQGDGLLTLADLPPKIQADARRASVVRFQDRVEQPDFSGAVSSAHPPSTVLPLTPREAKPPTNATSNTASGFHDPEDFVLPEAGIDLRRVVEAFEMSLIEQALARTGGNKNQASTLLGMNRTTLVEKLRKRKRQAEGA